MNKEHQRKIDQINEWVRRYKEEGDMEAGEALIAQFQPFILKQCNKYHRIYAGVHPWEHVVHEANTIFYMLLNEYTIGGDAYFNVFIQRKLPLRLRYFFIQEIKRRQRDLSHSEDQFIDYGLIGSRDDTEHLLDGIDQNEKLKEVLEVLNSDAITDRERDMIIRNIIKGESHESIATSYGISRSRVSRIIKGAIEKIQGKVRYRP